MSRFANVIFAYSPKNDDELELKCGEKIEVIGVEEEGWWRGKLKGKLGVFPSNFVELVAADITPEAQQQQQQESSIAPTPSLQDSNKSHLFGKSSKTSVSTNSLNSNASNNNSSSNNRLVSSINSGSNNNNNNNNNNNKTFMHSNGNNVMNSTQIKDAPQSSILASEEPTVGTMSSGGTPNERRPGAMGFGDIFAQAGVRSKPLPADPTSPIGAGGLMSASLLKQIPKKPPPPAPTIDPHGNTNDADQAPALPPKPPSQFSPHLPHSRPPILPPSLQQQQQTLHTQHPQQLNAHQQQVRQQARVVYAYQPQNEDELSIEVGDIINILDKDIEDVGWWKGELRGKIGLFPDNFVEEIKLLHETQGPPIPPPLSSMSKSSVGPTSLPQTSNNTQLTQSPVVAASLTASSPMSALGWQTQQSTTHSGNSDAKVKSVFAGTPKGFSKELESSIERHSNPASFLSLKRNKFQQQQQQQSLDMSGSRNHNFQDAAASSLNSSDEANSPSKLNHLTANRSKGPARRPPSNFLNKQRDQSPITNLNRRDVNGDNIPPSQASSLASLPIGPPSAVMPNNNHDNLSSLPADQQNIPQTKVPNDSAKVSQIAAIHAASVSLENVLDEKLHQNSLQTPSIASHKIGQRPAQHISTNSIDIAKSGGAKGSAPSVSTPTNSTPPWMVELRKAHAERKRDGPNGPRQSVSSLDGVENAPTSKVDETPPNTTASGSPPKVSGASPPKLPGAVNNVPTATTFADTEPTSDRKPSVQSLRAAYNPSAPTSGAAMNAPTTTTTTTSTTTPSSVLKSLPSRFTGDFIANNLPPHETTVSTTATQNASNIRNSLSTEKEAPVSEPLASRLNNILNRGSANSQNKHELNTNKSIANSNNSYTNGGNSQADRAGRDEQLSAPTPTSGSSVASRVAAVAASAVESEESTTPNRPWSTANKVNQSKPHTTLHNPNGKQETLLDNHQAKDASANSITMLGTAQIDIIAKQVANHISLSSDVIELKEEVHRLRNEVSQLNEMKTVFEVMRQELKACQSATENQRRYIKELVSNLADERKKISAMQVEIDRNLK